MDEAHTRESALPALCGMVFLLMAMAQVALGNTLADPDTGWHVRAGDWMLAHHALPAQDIWSFSAGQVQWYNISWLFDVLLAVLHGWGGAGLLYALTVVVYALLVSLLARDALRGGASPLIVLIFFTLCTVPLISQSALSRPQLISALMVYAYLRTLTRDAEDPQGWRLLWLPLLMLLWVNMHGGFLLAPVLFAAFLADALWHRDMRRAGRIIASGAVTAVAILVNPYGVHIVDAVLRTLSGTMMTYIDEWHAPDLTQIWYLLAVLACVAGLRPRDSVMPLAQKLLTLLMVLLLLQSARHGLIFAVVASPLLVIGLSRSFGATAVGQRYRQADAAMVTWFSRAPTRKTVMSLSVCAVLAVSLPPLQHGVIKEKSRFYGAQTLPQAIAWIEQNHPDMRWLNQYNLGGWLIYHDAPRHQLFIDGRAETAYGDAVLADYLAMAKAGADSEAMRVVLARYGITGVIASITDSPVFVAKFAEAEQWQEIYRNGDIVLFSYRPRSR